MAGPATSDTRRTPTLPLLHASRPLGRLVRLPFRLIPRGTVLPVLLGPGRGLRWLAGEGPHSIWLGFNEWTMRHAFARALEPGMTVYDIGANVGSFTLLASRRVGADGNVLAFEPLGELADVLDRHLALNGVSNAKVIRAAVWRESGPLRFAPSRDRLQGRVADQGQRTVEGVSLDALLAGGQASPPDVIKIDVEGAEADVLAGGLTLLRQHRPLVFFATHGVEARAASHDILKQLEYRITPIGRAGDEWLARPNP